MSTLESVGYQTLDKVFPDEMASIRNVLTAARRYHAARTQENMPSGQIVDIQEAYDARVAEVCVPKMPAGLVIARRLSGRLLVAMSSPWDTTRRYWFASVYETAPRQYWVGDTISPQPADDRQYGDTMTGMKPTDEPRLRINGVSPTGGAPFLPYQMLASSHDLASLLVLPIEGILYEQRFSPFDRPEPR